MTNKFFILAITVFFLNACGGGSSSNSDSNATPSTTVMVPNQIYTVNPGDKLIKTASDTVVKIRHTDGHLESTIELIAGEATIIRK